MSDWEMKERKWKKIYLERFVSMIFSNNIIIKLENLCKKNLRGLIQTFVLVFYIDQKFLDKLINT